ncbi:MAG: hypothetical protein FRC54_05635 [bacterium LCO1.1]|uniref:Uncharacterized protein n=1 Tax=Candidatus Weimeria bifida TaxID=2599074 RepID=A0A6N7IYH6_9FIRM|nr:hypothetical protein [Candidatus Weimeria bifida]
MPIIPVMYQQTLQNTQAVSQQKGADDARPNINQQVVSDNVTKSAEQAQRTVAKKSESAKESALNPDGNNGGAALSDQRRNKKKKEEVTKEADGKVIKKGAFVSFDVKV